MDKEAIVKITKTIHRRFPEVSGVKPKIKKQPIPYSKKKDSPEKENYLLTYSKNVEGPKGQAIPRTVRVVATPKGKIIKITTSK